MHVFCRYDYMACWTNLKLVSLYKLECIRIKHKNKAMIKIGVSWCQEHFHPLVSGSRSVPTADTSSSWNCDKNRSSYCLHSTHAKYIKSRLQQSWDINVLDNRGALVTSHLHCWSQICWYYTCCQSQIEFEISDSQVYIVWLLGKDTLYRESLKGKSQIFTQCVCKWTMKIAPRVNHSFASNTRWRKKRHMPLAGVIHVAVEVRTCLNGTLWTRPWFIWILTA